MCVRAGLGRDWAPLDLRHIFVSLLSDDGMAIEKIARLAGHASSQVTESVYRQELRSATPRLGALRCGLGQVLATLVAMRRLGIDPISDNHRQIPGPEDGRLSTIRRSYMD